MYFLAHVSFGLLRPPVLDAVSRSYPNAQPSTNIPTEVAEVTRQLLSFHLTQQFLCYGLVSPFSSARSESGYDLGNC